MSPEQYSVVRSSGFAPRQTQGLSAIVDGLALGSLAGRALASLEEVSQHVPTGLSWDVPLAGGLMVPSFTILGAKPKCGKSTLVTYIADNVVAAGHYVYYLDFENGLKRTFKRLMSRLSRMGLDEMPAREAHMRQNNPDFRDAREVVTNGYLSKRFFLESNRKLGKEDLEKRIESIWCMSQSDGKKMVLIVDSIQKLWMENLSDRRSGIDSWLRYFEYIRDRYDIAILATSELKRPQEGQVYKANEISLKESGDMEYTADMVISLDRPSGADGRFIDEATEKTPIKVTIVFNRDGPSGRLRKDIVLEYPYHGVSEVEAT